MGRYDVANSLAPANGTAKIGRGFALTKCFHSFVGQIADVEISGGDIRVRRVHAVVDCGFAIDPPNVVAQVRSAINFGLSAALFGKIEFDQGKVVQSNFDSYPVLTLDNAPDITVEIINSGAEIGGIGEIGTPGIAPAVANAIFVAIGKRLRSLPFTLENS
jgi:isoquinoline 1-oxidoreductase beta subunit